jgi:hypothetical protein
MTDTAGAQPPFPGFPGFPPAEMLDKMWDMMRLTPFGAAFPGMHPGTAQGMGSPLSAMSDMMAPLVSVEELDKRITDMRAVEQWLKLNLSMLQSAIQGLEVQRATLATLRAFGAFARESMTQPESAAGSSSGASPQGSRDGASAFSSSWARASEAEPGKSADAPAAEGERAQPASAEGAPDAAAFDPSGWWNLLQSQFNQLAAFAMTQPGAAGAEADSARPDAAAAAAAGGAKPAGAKAAASGAASAKAAPKRPAAKRPAARKSAGKAPDDPLGGEK